MGLRVTHRRRVPTVCVWVTISVGLLVVVPSLIELTASATVILAGNPPYVDSYLVTGNGYNPACGPSVGGAVDQAYTNNGTVLASDFVEATWCSLYSSNTAETDIGAGFHTTYWTPTTAGNYYFNASWTFNFQGLEISSECTAFTELYAYINIGVWQVNPGQSIIFYQSPNFFLLKPGPACNTIQQTSSIGGLSGNATIWTAFGLQQGFYQTYTAQTGGTLTTTQYELRSAFHLIGYVDCGHSYCSGAQWWSAALANAGIGDYHVYLNDLQVHT